MKMKMKWVGVILFTLTTFIICAQKPDETLFNNNKWEIGYSLPTTFGGENTAVFGSTVIFKKSFINRNGKDKAYRFGLNFSNRYTKVLNSSSNYKSNIIFIGPQFGIENRKYLSSRFYLINGLQTGFDVSFLNENLAKGSSVGSESKQYSIMGEYFLGLKYYFNRNISITSESSASFFYSSSKFYPANQDNINHNLDFRFLPLKRLYISYNF